MCGGGPSAPTPPQTVAEAPQAPTPAGGSDTEAARDTRRRAVASGTEGGRSTILTGSRGVQNGAATTKTLLGQ